MIFIELAVRNLRRHKVRSVLATVGIIIGVVAIASLGIMGSSLSTLVGGMVSDVSDTVLVTPHLAASSGDPFDPRNTLAARISERNVGLVEKAAGQHRVVPMIVASDRLRVRDTSGYATIYAMPAADIPFLLELEAGLYPQGRSSGVMVGSLLADEFDLHPGSRIEVGGESVRVMGVAAERGMGIDINPDYAIIVTEDWYTERHGAQDYSRVVVKVSDLSAIEDVKASIDQQINRRKEVVDILDSREILEIYYETIDAMNVFLLGIGGVSLLVASVSILNVMIISVTERTAEIGLMRSIGARRREVLRMFLYESLILGAMGSIVGGTISAVVAYYASASVGDLFADFAVSGEAGIPVSVVIGYVTFAMAFGIGTSVVAGFYPSWKAAQLNPIEALRYE
ncbi:ABC transporter permease [Methanoculleus horonobensis]|jgi:putative ABC transport system permease protein|uniref:ABC transporter permease n=1 Tax=Methanoculleus horonobensis TaxID=528314 RepID=UPI000833E28D|nr:FtsX-like permease family protein [Methanoculleus horonobensis]MDD3069763.1 ABC transporter permease [Methanoculleus horonobensis]MDD4251694.1 ABC transporter permease [Methanoculleus horonobensis]